MIDSEKDGCETCEDHLESEITKSYESILVRKMKWAREQYHRAWELTPTDLIEKNFWRGQMAVFMSLGSELKLQAPELKVTPTEMKMFESDAKQI